MMNPTRAVVVDHVTVIDGSGLPEVVTITLCQRSGTWPTFGRVNRWKTLSLEAIMLLHRALELLSRRFLGFALTVLRFGRPDSSLTTMEPDHRPSEPR
jgi:hypothetical protein